MESDAKTLIPKAKRIVVKVGSATLCDATGVVKSDWLNSLCSDLISLRKAGAEILIVSSGAVALGRSILGYSHKSDIVEKQAASACGQALLIEAWRRAFSIGDVDVAQILLTLDDTEGRRRYLNARNTIDALISRGIVPIANENDTIATSEIRYGDNDRLAAHVAQLASADCLLILSDIDGVYTADPRSSEGAVHIPYSKGVPPELLSLAGGPNATHDISSGGMKTKLEAAKIAAAGGCSTVIAQGDILNPIQRILDGNKATVIASEDTVEGARRLWIAGRLKPLGSLVVDDGAVKALEGKSSLLAAGIIRVQGDFNKGDAVQILDKKGVVIGQGLVTMNALDIEEVKGLQTSDLEAVIGFRQRSAIIERRDLVLLK